MSNNNYKYVLTGGPCCGKTSIVDYLESQGHLVLPESARIILEMRKADGLEFNFQAESQIICLQNEMENLAFRLANQRIFMDRSTIDGLAYSEKMFGSIPQSAKNVKTRGCYDIVFLLERLPFKTDQIRIESSDAQANEIHNCIKNKYEYYGYSPVTVPLFPSENIQKGIESRAEFILKKVEEYEHNK